MDDDRPRPPLVGNERDTVDGWLDYHRATLLWKCEGLRLDQLTLAAVPPSKLTLLGLVRHMTDVERGWLLPFLREPFTPLYATDEDPDGEFDVSAADAEGDLARFGETVDALSDLVARRHLDEVEIDDGTAYSLRWILTHLVEEYARHNGHADLLREAIDGSTGD